MNDSDFDPEQTADNLLARWDLTRAGNRGQAADEEFRVWLMQTMLELAETMGPGLDNEWGHCVTIAATIERCVSLGRLDDAFTLSGWLADAYVPRGGDLSCQTIFGTAAFCWDAGQIPELNERALGLLSRVVEVAPRNGGTKIEQAICKALMDLSHLYTTGRTAADGWRRTQASIDICDEIIGRWEASRDRWLRLNVAGAMINKAASLLDLHKESAARNQYARVIESFTADGNDPKMDKRLSIAQQAVNALDMYLHGQQLTVSYTLSGLASDLDAAVDSLSSALPLAAEHSPGLIAASHCELGTALLFRFQLHHRRTDLDAAVEEFRLGHGQLGQNDPKWFRISLNLGSALLLADDYSAAEAILSRALSQCPSDGPLAGQLRVTLGRVRCRLYQSSRLLSDLDAGIDDLRAAHKARSSEPEAAQVRDDAATLLASALFDRYDLDHEREHLDEAAHLLNQRLDRAHGIPRRIGALHALSEMHLRRFRLIAEFNGLATAIEAAEEVLRLAAQDDESALAVSWILAEALSERYCVSSETADLDRAIDVASDGVRLSNGENRILCLVALGAALTNRALAAGSRADADRAVRVLTSAVDLSPPGSASGERARSRLGNALATRARLFGDPQDTDAAVIAYREAIKGTRDHYTLEGLASALISRAMLGGGLEDLNEAIALCQEATRVAPEHDRYRAQSLFTTALGRRAVRTESPEDLDGAIEAGGAALLAMPSRHPERPVCLSNLAAAYSDRYHNQRKNAPESLDGLPDLDKAIDLLGEALEIVPAGNGQRPSLLANRTSFLTDRFAAESQASDFDAAVECANMAIGECPEDRAERAQLHYLRARVFLAAAKRQADIVSPQQLTSAVQDLRTAADAPLASPTVRVVALTELAERTTDPNAALACYEEIIPLTSLLVSPALSHSEREGLLVELKPVFREAAATALDAGARERALEILEYGRSIDWSQTARADLDLSPTPYSSLRSAAAEGAIVLINIATRRSDAVALTPDGLHVIPLTSATPAEVEEHVTQYIDGLANMETGGPELVFGKLWAEEMRTTLGLVSRGENLKRATLMAKRPLEWLWEAVAEPVLTALGHLGTPADVIGASWPRVWWCPVGVLAHLPIHAAGRHFRGAAPGECVIDRVVSSYTPSLRALLEAQGRPTTSDDRRMLVVAMPETPGLPALPDADDDISVLTERFGERITVITGTEANREGVCAALPRHNWAHFSCHGVFEPLNPVRSGLRFYDETLTVADILNLRLENAEFAFLSSCNSAVSGYRLPDDGMSVAAALHAAGFRHVVAATWIVLGRYAGFVSDHLYRVMNADRNTRPPQFAVALHQALRELRAQPDMELGVWIPFVHIGP